MNNFTEAPYTGKPDPREDQKIDKGPIHPGEAEKLPDPRDDGDFGQAAIIPIIPEVRVQSIDELLALLATSFSQLELRALAAEKAYEDEQAEHSRSAFFSATRGGEILTLEKTVKDGVEVIESLRAQLKEQPTDRDILAGTVVRKINKKMNDDLWVQRIAMKLGVIDKF